MTARLTGSDGLRHTPAGLPVLRLRVAHASRQAEGGRERQVELESEAAAFGDVAMRLAKAAAPGALVRLTGFLDRKGMKNPALELHVTEFALIGPATPDHV